MGKLRSDFRVGMLGAINGLFSVSIFLLVARVDAYYSYVSQRNEPDYAYIHRGVEDLWWMPVALWQVMLSTAASLLVHRYRSNVQKGPFITWLAIGTIALFGWALTLSVGFGLACLMDGKAMSLESAIGSDLRFLTAATKYVSGVFAGNVVYGSLVEASSRLYGEQGASLVEPRL